MTRPAIARALRAAPSLPALLLALACLAFAGCADGAATTHVEVRFSGQASDTDADVASDLSSRPTADAYAQAGIAHVDGYTAHDQLQDWKDAGGLDFAAQSFNGSFGSGFFLTSLGGVAADGSSAYWSLSINGEASDVGMSDAILHAGDRVTWTYTRVGAVAPTDPDPIGVTVDPPAPTQGETATVTGSVNHPARISIDGGPSVEAGAGRWSLESPPLAFGRTPAVLRIDDGVHSVAVDVTFVRLASGTFEALYTAYPLHADISDVVWYDPGVLASLPQYEGKATARATAYSVHDFMAAWTTATGREIEYSYSDDFGFGVSKVDGIGQPISAAAPPYWCYKVNGETADLGISLQPMQPGDVVTWEYGGCA
jgi:hypothetical protein